MVGIDGSKVLYFDRGSCLLRAIIIHPETEKARGVFALHIDVLGSFSLVEMSYVALVNTEEIIQLVDKVFVKLLAGFKHSVLHSVDQRDSLRALKVVSILCIDVVTALIEEMIDVPEVFSSRRFKARDPCRLFRSCLVEISSLAATLPLISF